MKLSGPLQWWDEWQLRVLVLSSLLVQGFLFFAFWIRKVHALCRLRAVVWIAYIGGDAVAIYALATLFNRHKEVSPDGVAMSSSLEIIWAPVLLIHLGGQASISAFSIEDNELWKRHIITLVCQVAVALYVFCKWWSGEDRQLKAAVLLFLVGIIRFARKPWALWRASFDSLMASADVGVPKPPSSCWSLCNENFLQLSARMAREKGGTEEGAAMPNMSLEEYVEQAKKCATEVPPNDDPTGINAPSSFYKLFIDMSAPYNNRLRDLRAFLKFDNEGAHKFFGGLLDHVFQMLYTDVRSSANGVALCLVILLPCLVISSLVLFAKSQKDGYKKADITVTYILLTGNIAHELSPLLLHPILSWATSKLTSCHDMVYQYNLISCSVRKENPTILMKLATFKCLGDYINKHCYIEQVPEALNITTLLSQHVRDGWREYISDTAGYKRFNSFRGQRTLRGGNSVRKISILPFDHSVLLWHIVTDLCFHYQISTTSGRQKHAAKSRLISNYMAYLFSERPEMLMPGTRPGFLNIAAHQLELIMMDMEEPIDNEEILVRELMMWSKGYNVHTAESPEAIADIQENYKAFGVIVDACHIAESLMGLEELHTWSVIQGVWVEMLCYSASRCRGYLHAKSLGQGGEYLTTVWLLWSFMGMETLTYMIQSPQVTREEGDIDDLDPVKQ